MPSTPPTEVFVTVVVADDHPFFRRGLAKFLRASGIEVVGEAANGWAAVREVERTAPDVVVLDLNMPEPSGADLIRRLTECAPESRVLVVSISVERSDVATAMEAGANGYFLKDGPVEELVAGIRAVAAGERLVSPRVASIPLGGIRERE